MKDGYSKLSVVHGIDAQVINTGGGAKNSGDIDLQGFDSALILFNTGANGGDTLSGTNKFTVKVEHADDDGTGSAGAYSDCDSSDIIGVTPVAGVVVTIDDAAEDQASYAVVYIGDKRFVKITITPNGTLTNGNPCSVNIVKGHPFSCP